MPFKQTYSFANRQGTALSLKHIFKQPLTGPSALLYTLFCSNSFGHQLDQQSKAMLSHPSVARPTATLQLRGRQARYSPVPALR